MNPILWVDDIHTYYGDSYILQGLSLKSHRASVVALVGRNGMGKTTAMRSIMGFTHPRRGKIFFKDVDITPLLSYQVSQLGISLVPQGRRIFSSLSVKENLMIAARHTEKSEAWNLEKVFSFFPIIRERIDNRGNQLSGGELQMLAIARSLISNPDFILMDEPSEGLAPLAIQNICQIIQQLKERGLSILLAEQNLDLALSVADYVYVLSKGTVVYENIPLELENNEEVKQEYLAI
ncbi:MAG TPA: ABC transporter ATP-binding protein [Thermodesulfobacteriota bacterium]|nr:ABC transporter ATP-binding protein [Thermodesulfobacteriota bacterium]